MVGDNQQRILGYFIEEAKEHLETLEKGILDLPTVVQDSERINEMFRAAHSVKGGAAMLGYGSIQKTSHRLEDAFKVLKEEKEVKVDQQLESLFLKAYDVLNDLVERLQSPFGLRDEDADEIIQEAEPHFQQLLSYIDQLVGGGGATPTSQPVQATPAKPAAKKAPDIATQAKSILKEMLQLFKQKSSPESRKKLKILGDRLIKLAPNEKKWVVLVRTAQKAMINPKHSYRLLAPVVMKELKQGSDLLHLQKVDQIAASTSLKQLAAAKAPQILIPVEPKAAAKGLKQAFNKQQLSQLVQLLGATP